MCINIKTFNRRQDSDIAIHSGQLNRIQNIIKEPCYENATIAVALFCSIHEKDQNPLA